MSAAGPRKKQQTRKIAIQVAESYRFLSAVWANDEKVFTDSHNTGKRTFAQLYAACISRSSKTQSILKDKLTTDFAKLALLVNVGRIDSTRSFFPEVRTATRTYHPIPCLQRSKNLLDAPRIKSVLRACEGADAKNGLATPAQLLARAKAGQIPPTTLPNLLFVLSNHSSQIGRDHLHDTEFLDIFLPSTASSESRARLFLYLCYHYHETLPDDGRRRRAEENIDTEEEKALAIQLVAKRETILREQSRRESAREKAALTDRNPSKPPKTKRGSVVVKRKGPAVKEEMEEDEDEPEDDGERRSSPHAQRYSPYQRAAAPRSQLQRTCLDRSPAKAGLFLPDAWQALLTSDPLADSDDEDEYCLAQRLATLTDLRRQALTPEPDGLRPMTPLHLDSWHDDILLY
ncbi:hypothetical protein C8F01DRAFT_1109881 [Mycena amicta]|nr:hypothetical protein C8F01DRAFT_1109881 [Mycena amicta]